MMKLCDAAAVTAARIAARFRNEFDGPAEIDVTLAEDNSTIIIFAGVPGRTVTAATDVSELGETDIQDFARHLEARLGRPTLRIRA